VLRSCEEGPSLCCVGIGINNEQQQQIVCLRQTLLGNVGMSHSFLPPGPGKAKNL
jgi:hypothetical protein